MEEVVTNQLVGPRAPKRARVDRWERLALLSHGLRDESTCKCEAGAHQTSLPQTTQSKHQLCGLGRSVTRMPSFAAMAAIASSEGCMENWPVK